MRSTIRLRDALRQAGVDDRHMFAHPNSVKAGSTPISPRTRDRGRFPGGSSFTKDPEIGSMDHTSGLYTVQSAAAQPVWRQGSTSSFASLIPRTIPQHHLRRSQSSRRSKKERFAQKKADVARGALTRNTQQEDGLIYSKLTTDILRNALGPQVLKTISTAWAPEVGVTNLDTAQTLANGAEAKATLRELVGSKDTSGKLQVVVSGPAGFIFYVESMLTELGVPSEVVFVLD
ncbi:unnamed protein product [Ascophyllum nodosum]